MICDLYQARVDAQGNYEAAEKLIVNRPGASTADPSVGIDKATGQEFLYFASNRPGGKGQMDLYRSEIDPTGQVGAATNLTELNTEDDEISPFWYAPTQTLYFSTDGRFSFGEKDLYQTTWTEDGFSEAPQPGPPRLLQCR